MGKRRDTPWSKPVTAPTLTTVVASGSCVLVSQPLRCLLLASLMAAVTAPATAERAPDDRCTAAIQRASGRLADCLLAADATLVVSEDTARDRKKRDRCERAFARRHAKIVRRYGADPCPDDTAAALADTVAAATATVTATVTDADPDPPARLGPMTAPVQGMNYEPAPSNYTVPPAPIYFDTDFYNQDFVQLWGPGTPPEQPNGRNDMGDMLSLGVNFVRLFNWDPSGPVTAPFRNHQSWLDYVVQDGGKRMFVPAVFANGNRGTAAAQMVVDQFNGFSGAAKAQVAVWLVGNEISPSDPFTAETLQVIRTSARPPLDTLPICVPFQMSSTADALGKIKESWAQFLAAGVQDRFLACLNFYGLGRPVSQQTPAAQLTEFIDGFFADAFVTENRIGLLLTEIGINFDGSSNVEPNAGGDAAKQGTHLGEILAQAKVLQAKYPRFLGQTVFEYTNESWKTPLTEASFGLYALTPQAPPLTGRTTRPSDPPYPVDSRVPRPQHQAVADHY